MYEDHTENQKYIDYIQPLNQNIFIAINERLSQVDPSWYKKKILDYGCNIGHLLTTSNGIIDHSSYAGLDPQIKPLEIARKKYPNAHWIHYNGHHVSFNPTGDKIEKPKLPFRPEIIIAHGVFTHCDMATILETIEYFKQIIQPNGIIVFSLWEKMHYPQYLDIFLKNRLKIDVPNSVKGVEYNDSCYLINRNEVILDQEKLDIEQCDWIETFFTRPYILNKIPGALAFNGIKTKHTIFLLPT